MADRQEHLAICKSFAVDDGHDYRVVQLGLLDRRVPEFQDLLAGFYLAALFNVADKASPVSFDRAQAKVNQDQDPMFIFQDDRVPCLGQLADSTGKWRVDLTVCWHQGKAVA